MAMHSVDAITRGWQVVRVAPVDRRKTRSPIETPAPDQQPPFPAPFAVILSGIDFSTSAIDHLRIGHAAAILP